MTAISFKSVGETTAEKNQRRALENTERLPLGIMTPVRSGDDSEGIFKMHRNVEDLVHDNFRNLLLTNHGDRVILYDFGANLQPLTFELTSPENFDTEAMMRIKRATEKYMPFITLVEFESNSRFLQGPQSTGRVDITITYDVPRLNISNKRIIVAFYVGG